MKGIIFVFSLIFSYILGFTLNKGLSSTNVIKETSEEGIEFLKYDIPFMYTVRLNEIIIIILLTVLICAIYSFYYKESKSSLRQILKIMERIIWSELLLFSFIIGTWSDNLLKDKGENGFIYMSNPEILPVSIVIVLLLFVYIWASYQTSKDNCKIEKKSDLYPSRKILLPIIDEYLGSIESISIIGDWGIGKSKLIENFFHTEKDKNDKKYSDKYESIIIDVSSYSENKKIISVIQEELVKILTKHKIFKININFVEKVFVENNDFLKSIKNIFFCKDSLIESKENLNEKIEELYTKNKKRIVLCLDNLERLSDVDRIINLLCITDDLLSGNIKKIYLYDKEYMNKIFDKKDIVFKEFMDKYSGVEIEVNKVEIKEIKNVKETLNLTNDLNSDLNEKINIKERKIEKISSEISEFPSALEIDELEKLNMEIKELKNLLSDINKKLSNPRYVEYLNSFVCNKGIKYDKKIKFEYRLIVDVLKNYTFEGEIVKEFIDESTHKGKIKKEDFKSLFNKEYEKKQSLEEERIQDLRKKGIETTEGDNLLDIIEILKKYERFEIIQDIFEKKDTYSIEKVGELQRFIDLYLKDKIEIYMESKMKIILSETLCSYVSENLYKELESYIKLDLIPVKLINLSRFLIYLFNKNLDYKNKILNFFYIDDQSLRITNIKNESINKEDVKEFITFIEAEFIVFEKSDNKILKEILNKDDLLKKEIEILRKLQFKAKKQKKIKD
ncbi:MAG: P-loop NTPase fold protein [Cetobacterium sp.]